MAGTAKNTKNSGKKPVKEEVLGRTNHQIRHGSQRK
jgi:hypothetical protein